MRHKAYINVTNEILAFDCRLFHPIWMLRSGDITFFPREAKILWMGQNNTIRFVDRYMYLPIDHVDIADICSSKLIWYMFVFNSVIYSVWKWRLWCKCKVKRKPHTFPRRFSWVHQTQRRGKLLYQILRKGEQLASWLILEIL